MLNLGDARGGGKIESVPAVVSGSDFQCDT
jgi:hypothetical protein